MRNVLMLLVVLALTACAAPTATPSTAQPSAGAPGNATGAPPAETPTAPSAATAGPTAAPTAEPTAPAAAPADGDPIAEIGYGQARAAAFLPADDAIAVATEAGLLVLELPGLETRSFTPITSGGYEIAVSPDGRTVALAQYRGPGEAVVLVGPLGGAPERELVGTRPVFSPDGSVLAALNYDTGRGRATTSLYRVADGELIAKVDGQGPRFSPDGRLMATTFEREALISRIDGAELLRRPGFAVAFSPDGALVAFAGEGGVSVHPLRDGVVDVETTVLHVPGGLGLGASFGSDGRLFAQIETELQVWDVATQSEVAGRLPAYDVTLVDPSGQMVALGSVGGDGPSNLQILRVSDGETIYEDGQPLGGQAAFGAGAAAGQALVIDLTGRVSLVDSAQGAVASRVVPGYDRAAIDAPGAEVALGRGLLVDLHPLADGEPRLRVGEFRLYDGLRELSFDGARLIAEVNRFSFGAGIGQFDAVAWDTESGTGGGPLREQKPLAEGAFGFSEMGQPIAWDFDPASGRMAWRDADGAVYLDDGTPESAALVAGAPEDVRAIALAPGGGRLAFGDAAGELFVVDAASRGPLMRGPAGEGRAITDLAWSADGAWLALRLESGDVLLQEVADDDPPLRIAGGPADPALPGGGMALSADGAVVAAAGSDGAAVYRRADGAELLRVDGPAGGLALSPDGSTLVVIQGGRALVYAVGQ